MLFSTYNPSTHPYLPKLSLGDLLHSPRLVSFPTLGAKHSMPGVDRSSRVKRMRCHWVSRTLLSLFQFLHVVDTKLRVRYHHRVGLGFSCWKKTASQIYIHHRGKPGDINDLLKDYTSGHKLTIVQQLQLDQPNLTRSCIASSRGPLVAMRYS